MRGFFAAITAILLFAGSAAADDFEATSGSGSMWVHEAAAAQLGLAIMPVGAKRQHGGLYREYDVRFAGALAFNFGFGHYAYSRAGSLALQSRIAVTAGKRTRQLVLDLVPQRGGDAHLALATPDGAVWFTLDDVHQRYDGGREVAFGYQDLRVGPALAQFAKQPKAIGQFVGAMHFRLEGDVESTSAKATEACLSPSWPGTNGTTTDVALNAMAGAQAICPTCTGAANSSAKVKIVPSVELRNVGTSDVPWYTMFYDPASPAPSNTPTPPYGIADPHPALVWNVYRVDAAGRLAQVARSGLKHAFATNNDGCTCGNFRVLAPNCRDTYNVASNEFEGALGPRRDVIPHTGEFGRCGSRFDDVDQDNPGGVCDGEDDRGTITPLDYRAIVDESLLASGGRWFVEAWYVVRNDVNLYNTMGTREFTPTWTASGPGGFWAMPLADAALMSGSVLERYAALPQVGNVQMLVRDVTTSTGKLKILSRAESIGGGRWLYEYQLGNYEFSRPVTSGAGDLLQVLRNRGIAGLTVPTDANADVAGIEFFDATGSTADDWSAAIGVGTIGFTAPANNTLDWGSMYRVSFTSTREPSTGNLVLAAFEGTPGTVSVEGLVPTGAAALLLDGFE